MGFFDEFVSPIIDYFGGGGGGVRGDVGSLSDTIRTGTTPTPSYGDDYSAGAAPQPSGGMPDAGGAPDTGGGFGDLASRVGSVIKPIGDVAKGILPAAQLGTGVMGIVGGIQGAKNASAQAALQRRAQKLQEESAGATRAAAAPLTQFGEEQLTAARGGQIPAAIQARIDQWKQGYLAQIRDRLARTGQGDSDALMQWQQYVEQQGKAMEAAYLESEMQRGTGAIASGANVIGSAGQQAGAVAQGAQTEGDAILKLMEQANKVLASVTQGAS